MFIFFGDFEPDGSVWKFEYYISGLMSRVVRPDGN